MRVALEKRDPAPEIPNVGLLQLARTAIAGIIFCTIAICTAG